MQFIAPKFREASLVRVGARLERAGGRRTYTTKTAPVIDALYAQGEAATKRHDELIALISAPDAAIDRVIEANKELARLDPLVKQYSTVKSLRDERESLDELARTSDEKDITELAREELRAIDAKLPEQEHALRIMLLPRDDADDRGAILEVRAGAGGDEAALFAAELFRMYALHARKSGWRFETLNMSETDGKGIREGSAEVLGDGVFGRLKFESGVHRVQRVPETETQGRVHTSTASVAVLPHAEDVDMDIRD